MDQCHIRKCWDKVIQDSQLQQREEEVARFNAENRWRKRGITATPTKFGISFTTKFLNQVGGWWGV
jgi:xanthine dehydrogenase/oxidase